MAKRSDSDRSKPRDRGQGDGDLVLERLRRHLEFLGLNRTLDELDERLAWAARGRAGALAGGPRESVVELVAGAGQSKELEVSPESLEDEVVVSLSVLSRFASVGVVSLGHGVVSSVRDRDAEVRGRRSYSVRSRGAVRT